MTLARISQCRPASALYSAEPTRHYFAHRLRCLPGVDPHGEDARRYAEIERRHVNFVRCLLTPEMAPLTYDLRIISAPDPEQYSRGRIDVAFVCRADGCDSNAAARHAAAILDLTQATFPEYDFDLVRPEEVPQLLAPFPATHVLAIRRRCARIPLDTVQADDARRARVGFGPGLRAGAMSKPDAAVVHVFPFLPPSAPPFPQLFSLLLHHPVPIVVSCRLRPAALEAEEAEFVQRQVAVSERYSQVSLGAAPDDLSSLRPTLRDQARACQFHQTRLWLGLRDHAGLMTVELASPEPIPATVAGAAATVYTEPAGGSADSVDGFPLRYLAGGHDTISLDDGGLAGDVFARLEFTLPPHTSLPAGAGRLLYLFGPGEAAAGFRLPPPSPEPSVGLPVRSWRVLLPPPDLPERGALIGVHARHGQVRPVRIAPEDRMRHVYCLGQTGTGKTTALMTMILDDIRSGEGVCVIDPAGDLYAALLGRIPADRRKDVVLLDPADTERPVGLNLLECDTNAQRYFLVQEFTAILTRLIEDEFGDLKQYTGPIFFQHMRMNLLLAMSNPEDPGSLLDFHAIYQTPAYWKRWLPLRVQDPYLERWVRDVLPTVDYLKQGSDSVSLGGYVGSKFEGFVFDPMLRNIFGQKRSTINPREIMDRGQILLVNLAKGELAECNSRFLGMVLLAKLQAAAMSRVRVPQDQRRPFHVYVDEAGSVTTRSLGIMLSEARKFGVTLVLASQYTAQLRDRRLMESISGNVGSLISFRVGQADAEFVEREMSASSLRSSLLTLPNWTAYVRLLVNGQITRPFVVETRPPEGRYRDVTAAYVRVRSRERYGRPRAAVEAEIARSIACPSRSQKADAT